MENINSNLVGLTDSEVQKRIDEGKVNISTNIKTKSIKRIFCDNIFTLFNLINVILLAALIFVGSHKNMLFIGVVIANIIIGIVQEIRSKISVDKLTILSEKKINVLRNGKIAEISKDEIVLDDILVLSRGSQMPTALYATATAESTKVCLQANQISLKKMSEMNFFQAVLLRQENAMLRL